jgi:hypothetical protein
MRALHVLLLVSLAACAAPQPPKAEPNWAAPERCGRVYLVEVARMHRAYWQTSLPREVVMEREMGLLAAEGDTPPALRRIVEHAINYTYDHRNTPPNETLSEYIVACYALVAGTT